MRSKPSGYMLLLAGHSVSTFGSSIYVVTLVLYLADATDSALALGTVQFLSYLPAALLGPIAGALVDAWDRRRVIIWSDIVRGLLMVGLATAAFVMGAAPVWLLMLVTMAVSLAGVLFAPAVHALMPELVEAHRLKRANGARSAGTQIANLAGSAAGGALYLAFGAPLLILANGVSFVASGVSECFIRPSVRPRSGPGTPAPSHIAARVREGFDLLRREPGVRSLVAVQAGVNLILPPLVVVFPFVITDVWGLSAEFFGYLFAAVLAGGVVGFLGFSGSRTTPASEAAVYLGAPIVLAGVIAGLGALASPAGATSPVLVPALFMLMLVAGACVAVMHMVAVTRIQQAVDPAMRGRVFATLEMATAVLVPAAYLIAGFVGEALRSQPWIIFVAVAGVAGVAALVVVTSRSLRRLLRGSVYS